MATEKRLIYANALLSAIDEYMGTVYDCPLNEVAEFQSVSNDTKVIYAVEGLYEAAEIIDEQPTVDAVELPCKVGDMVHRKDGAWNVVGFECDRSGSWKVKLERWKDQFWDCHESTKVVFKSFGKTLFLTREEAEAALAKMDGDGNG